jgi:tetratricopeptide (TPR) repeat protein
VEFYPIQLTPADVLAAQECFHREFAGLLGSSQVTVLPPFPDYDLLSQSRAPKILLRAVNDVVLSRRPVYEQEHGWLLLPLIREQRVMGVLLAEEPAEQWRGPEELLLLERLIHLCLDRLLWEKRAMRDGETLLWRRQALVRELMRAIDLAENGGRLAPRRLLSDGEGPAHFSLICLAVNPPPEPWAGAGLFWQGAAPQLREALPAGAVAAHLGGGYLGVLWPKANPAEVRVWTERLLLLLQEEERRFTLNDEHPSLLAGIVAFPEDFYDVGPFLPWGEGGTGGPHAAAEEVVRRAILAVEATRRQQGVQLLTYHSLREQGLVPRPESAIEESLSLLLKGEERCALLLVKLDDWEEWQRLEASKRAAHKANQVLEASRACCPPGAIVDWAGPEQFVVFLPSGDEAGAQAQGERLRARLKSELGTTVSIGMSVHPCPGFSPGDLLENARKALVHTGFFGPDTQTLFDAVSLNISGDRLFEAGKLEQAVQEFHRALVLDPDHVNVRNSLGVCYAQMGKLGEAVAEFTRVTALNSADFMPYYNLGCALMGLGSEGEAEHAFGHAAELDPAHAGVCFQLAKLCKQQNRLDEALRHLRRAVELRGQWIQAWRLLGEWLLELGDEDEAMAAFKRALRLHGKDAAALSGLAVAYGKKEANLEVALSLARRSVELEPGNPLFARRLAELLVRNEEPEEALVQCRRAARLAPDDEQIRQLLEKLTAAHPTSTS